MILHKILLFSSSSSIRLSENFRRITKKSEELEIYESHGQNCVWVCARSDPKTKTLPHILQYIYAVMSAAHDWLVYSSSDVNYLCLIFMTLATKIWVIMHKTEQIFLRLYVLASLPTPTIASINKICGCASVCCVYVWYTTITHAYMRICVAMTEQK